MNDQQESSHSNSDLDDGSLVVFEQEGLQLHYGRNLFQLIALLLFAVIGATIGWFQTEDWPAIAALIGGVLGMITGTFLSGLILMLVGPPKVVVTADEYAEKRRVMKRRFIFALLANVIFLCSYPFVLFGDFDSDLAVAVSVLWPALGVGLCVYAKGLASHMRTYSE